MSPTLLNRAVARQTGDDEDIIVCRGFSLTELQPASPSQELSLSVCCPGCCRDLPVSEDDIGSDPDDEFWTDCSRCDAAFPFHPDELFVVETVPTC